MRRHWSAAVAVLLGFSAIALPASAEPANRAPIARTDHLTGAADTPLIVLWRQLLGNDSAGRGESDQRLRVVSVADDPESPGRVFLVGGHAVFVPAPGFVGTARFRYTIKDDGGTRRGGDNTDTGRVQVTVGP